MFFTRLLFITWLFITWLLGFSPGFLSPGFLSPGFLSPGFLSPGFRERRNDLFFGHDGPSYHRVRVQAPQGVRNVDRLKVGPAEGLRLEQRRVDKRLGANHYCGYAPVLKGHGVVHTARGTGPSIRYGSDHEVTPFRQGVYNLRRGGAGVYQLVLGNSVS